MSAKRKIVQVATFVVEHQGDEHAVLAALADDGTLWLGDASIFTPDWRQVPALPDREEEPRNGPF